VCLRKMIGDKEIMKHKAWIILLVLGLCLIGVTVLVPHGSATVDWGSSATKTYCFVNGPNETVSSIFSSDFKWSRAWTATGAVSASSLSLRSKTGQTVKDTVWNAMTIWERPCGNRTLYGSALYIRTYAVLGALGTSANIVFNLSSYNGTSYQRNVSVVRNGTIAILGFTDDAVNITSCKVTRTSFASTWSYQVNQSRVGAVWKDAVAGQRGNYTQGGYTFDGTEVFVGKLALKGNLTLTNCSVSWVGSNQYSNTAWSAILYVRAAGKLKISNCYLYLDCNQFGLSTYTIYQDATDTNPLVIENSELATRYPTMIGGASSAVYINHTILRNWFIQILTNLYLRDVSFIASPAHVANSFAIFSCDLKACDQVSFDGYYDAVKFNALTSNIINSVVTNCDYLFNVQALSHNCSFKDCTSNTWAIDPTSSWGGGYISPDGVFRNHTVNVRLMNGTVPFSGGHVEYRDSTGSTKWNMSTSSNGYIVPQVTTSEKWVGSNTPVWVSPGQLIITAGNYHAKMNINLSLYGVGGCNLTIPVFNNWSKNTVTNNGGSWLSVINPNPGNGTHSKNFLKKDSTGLMCSVDVTARNFTTTGIPVSGFLNITGTPFSDSKTGIFNNSGLTYTDEWASSKGSNFIYNNYIIGQNVNDMFLVYDHWRSTIQFDTSSIPDTAVIDSAKIKFIPALLDCAGTNFNISLQNGMPNNPHSPLLLQDYNKANYSGIGGSLNTSTYPGDYFPWTMTLNSIGCGWINKIGFSKFIIRSSQDINGVSTSGFNDVYICAYESGIAFYPTINISYHTVTYSFSHLVNVSFLNSTNGVDHWHYFYNTTVGVNGTVTAPAPMFSGVGTYYWKTIAEMNHSTWSNSSVHQFTTVSSGLIPIPETQISQAGLAVSPFALVGTLLGLLVYRHKRKQEKTTKK